MSNHFRRLTNHKKQEYKYKTVVLTRLDRMMLDRIHVIRKFLLHNLQGVKQTKLSCIAHRSCHLQQLPNYRYLTMHKSLTESLLCELTRRQSILRNIHKYDFFAANEIRFLLLSLSINIKYFHFHIVVNFILVN